MKTNVYLRLAGVLLATGLTTYAQPTITNQPQPQTVVVSNTATFLVGATGAEPLTYQWQHSYDYFNYGPWPDATNSTLVITNVQVADSGYYRVVVTNVDGASTSEVAQLTVLVPPTIASSGQPTNFPSVSVGASVTNRVQAGGTTPFGYQWRHDGFPLVGQTKSSIMLTDLQFADKGTYDVVVTNIAGAITSTNVTLNVDPIFTKITTGAIVRDSESSVSGCWADINNDKYPELFVAQVGSASARNAFYLNSSGTNFIRVTASPFGTDYTRALQAAWADYDNDGYVDLIVANFDGGLGAQRLYRNNGNGTFTPVVDTALRSDTTGAMSPWWLDYDGDGFLDLFVAKGTSGAANDCLFRNNGDGTFKKMTVAEVGPMLSDLWYAENCHAIDYDNDGNQELTIAHLWPIGSDWDGTNLTWRPQADGTFVNTQLQLNQTGTRSWGDYNNDGRLDVFCAPWGGLGVLFQNQAVGGFVDATAALKMSSTVYPMAFITWGDYDNDGYLDLFFTGVPGWSTNNLNGFFHNDGDGTFTQILTGSPVWDGGDDRVAPCWVDYNNDGFLDLFIAVGYTQPRQNLLYRNNGNANHWMKVQLDGRVSNRSGIGAKVRAQAAINGKTFWQLREITCGNSYVSQNGLLAHFGLGDATNVTTLRIEWPSGIVQELQNVPANQFLTVVESQGYTNAPPQFSGAMKTAGSVELSFVEPAAGARYLLEASTNLVTWTKLMARTSAGGKAQFTDTKAGSYSKRFYRLQVP